MRSRPIFCWILLRARSTIGRSVAEKYFTRVKEMQPKMDKDIHTRFYFLSTNIDCYLHRLVVKLLYEFLYSFSVYISLLTQNIGR